MQRVVQLMLDNLDRIMRDLQLALDAWEPNYSAYLPLKGRALLPSEIQEKQNETSTRTTSQQGPRAAG